VSDPKIQVRTITQGPRHHWFGYYDKLAFDPTDRYVLANAVDFEHRTPRPEDAIDVGMVDPLYRNRWIGFGTSRAWSWQQGCMLQWRPGSKHEVLWNDRVDGRFVSHVLDIRTGERRTLPRPVYAVAPDGRTAISADFARIQRMRPGYGYAGVDDPCRDDRAPADSGIWRMDLDSGESELILSLAEVARLPHAGESLEGRWHYFNHLLVSPDGSRFAVLHRWRRHLRHPPALRALIGFSTRMVTANLDGSDVFILDPSGHTSHFVWRDPEHICAWTRPRGAAPGFWLLRDRTGEAEPVGHGIMTRNGHNTYLPGTKNEWILCDTYPHWRTRLQTPYLCHVPTRRRVELGAFRLPWRYFGEWRCDLHPRASHDGRTVAIDSPHQGDGRQIHLIDVGGAVDR
jgi:hypothetical protein